MAVDSRQLASAALLLAPAGLVAFFAFNSGGFYPGPPVAVPMGRMYTLGIRCFVGRCHAAALLAEVVALIERGRLRPEAVTTRVAGWDEALEAWPEPAIKLVVARR